MTSESSPLTVDVAIAGGSIAGLALALALARCLDGGLRVVVIERGVADPTAAAQPDPRAVAVSASSRHLLEALGVWSDVASQACPVTRFEITDSVLDAGLRPVLLAWDAAMPVAGDRGQSEPTAHIVPLAALARALAATVARERTVTVLNGEVSGLATAPSGAQIALDGGASIVARIAIAADGRQSTLRSAAGIKLVGWPYHQSGIVTTIAFERPHDGVATQHFLPAGPFAILPLPGKRACITWSEGQAEADRIMALDDAGFLDEVERRCGGKLGPITLAGPRRAWPLSLHLARSYVGPRVALVGDAAHAVHPIAGQGLNLALRDVAALAEVLADAARSGLDIGDAVTLARYQRWRRFDAATAAAAFDTLNTLFSRDVPLLRAGRELGLQIVDRLPFAKRMLQREAAGLAGELPRLLRGELA